jgi:hypothetical protein
LWTRERKKAPPTSTLCHLTATRRAPRTRHTLLSGQSRHPVICIGALFGIVDGIGEISIPKVCHTQGFKCSALSVGALAEMNVFVVLDTQDPHQRFGEKKLPLVYAERMWYFDVLIVRSGAPAVPTSWVTLLAAPPQPHLNLPTAPCVATHAASQSWHTDVLAQMLAEPLTAFAAPARTSYPAPPPLIPTSTKSLTVLAKDLTKTNTIMHATFGHCGYAITYKTCLYYGLDVTPLQELCEACTFAKMTRAPTFRKSRSNHEARDVPPTRTWKGDLITLSEGGRRLEVCSSQR